VPVVSRYHWHGRDWLTVTFPDGYPARIPVQDTDLGGAQMTGTGATVLSVSGIRRLRDLVCGSAAAPAGELNGKQGFRKGKSMRGVAVDRSARSAAEY
jgi:hypothetical protein